jgi:hypothetical protein
MSSTRDIEGTPLRRYFVIEIVTIWSSLLRSIQESQVSYAREYPITTLTLLEV